MKIPQIPNDAIVPKTLDGTAARLKLDFTAKIENPDRPGAFYKFSEKEKLFVLFYLTDANLVATHACKMAGYNCKDDRMFWKLASEMLRKNKIQRAINRAIAAFAMEKAEVIHRIGNQARGSIELFLNDQNEFCLETARQNGALGLVKK